MERIHWLVGVVTLYVNTEYDSWSSIISKKSPHKILRIYSLEVILGFFEWVGTKNFEGGAILYIFPEA